MKHPEISALVLALALITATLSGCGDTVDPPVDISSGDVQITEQTETTEVSDDLGDIRFDGREFNILTGEFQTYPTSCFSVEEETGDIQNDALYRRNSAIADRFGITFSENVIDLWDVWAEIRKTVSAGDSSYDMAMMIDRQALKAGIEGLLYSYNDLPNIDLSKPYWDQNARKDFTIDGKLFFSYGDDNLVFFGSMTMLAFNKRMISDYNLDNPYSLVYDGKWTYDRYIAMNKVAANDLNGDNKMDINDQWGTVITEDAFYPGFWLQDGLKIVEKDKDDIPYLNVAGNDALVTCMQKLAKDTIESNIWYNVNVMRDYETLLNGTGNCYNDIMLVFRNGKSLFASTSLITIMDTRSMEDDFGLVPFPASEEKEPGYIYGSRALGGFPYVVPVTADSEFSSAVMEALACESRRSVIPVMYDKVLKGKNTRDEDSANMLDMVRKNRLTEQSEIYWWDEIECKYEYMFRDGKDNVISLTEKITPKAQKTMDEAIEFFRSLD